MSPHVERPLPLYNGVTNGHGPFSATEQGGQKKNRRSHLRHTPADELHDLVCVGFGPASLAIGVALHDALEGADPELARKVGNKQPKVAFLERQPSFSWHSGMLLEGAKMQITFIKDMATLRNPRSEFTFLNYLHSNNRLVEFTNLDTFLPTRVEYEDYMRWCAGWFDEVVSYGQEVIHVSPETSKGHGTVESFIVTSRNIQTQEITTLRTKHVVVAVGGKPDIPKYFPQSHPRMIHSSQYSHAIPQLLPNSRHPYRVAVIGSGQSAAEIFDNIHSKYPNSKTRLIIRGAALKPSDDSPFVNEIFNPSRVNDIYHQDPTLRAKGVQLDKNTNYGVVRLNLIERIYQTLYTQRIRYASQEEWPHRLLTHRDVSKIEDSGAIPGGLRLHIKNRSGEYFTNEISCDDEILDVDLVVVATGYRRNMHEEILRDTRWLLPTSEGLEIKWNVARDYHVMFESGLVSPDAGVWLQGCNENTHGLSDTLLSVLAVRGGELVQSIFGKGSNEAVSGLIKNGSDNHAIPRVDSPIMDGTIGQVASSVDSP